MCIIVAVPMNVSMPSDETLKECFRSNPDGAGFMWADGKRVRIRKGFMTWQAFADALDAEEIPEGSALVMHFRIATHGKVQTACCHPFPVSDDASKLKMARCEARFGVAHNGVIQGRATNESWSDTMDFVASVLAPLARMNPSFMHNDDALDLLRGACRSKLAILDNAGDIALVGDFVEDGGVFYSNTSYLPTRWNWTSYRGRWETWSKYDEYYDTDYAVDYEGTGYNDEPWDDIAKLVEKLPWEACQLCPMAQECAMWEPECETEPESVSACCYYIDAEEEEGVIAAEKA